MHVNHKGQDAAEVATDPSLRSLIRACIDRYFVVNVNNLKETDTLAGNNNNKHSSLEIRHRMTENSTMKESVQQAKFIVNDCLVMKEQEATFPARLCAMGRTSFIVYVAPTLHMLEQVGVEITNPEGFIEKEALNLLVYSFSHLQSNNSYQSSYNLVKTGKEEKTSYANPPSLMKSSSRMLSVAGESRNRIYKPVQAGGDADERRRMIENNMKECAVF